MAVTANAATSYTEDFSAVEDAGAWWDTLQNDDIAASLSEDGRMILKNSSASGDRYAEKSFSVSGTAGVTVDMDLTSGRSQKGVASWEFADGNGNKLFTLTRTVAADSNWAKLVIADATGVATDLNGSQIEKFHLNIDVDYEDGKAVVSLTNVINKDNKKQDDSTVTLDTRATAGSGITMTTSHLLAEICMVHI